MPKLTWRYSDYSVVMSKKEAFELVEKAKEAGFAVRVSTYCDNDGTCFGDVCDVDLYERPEDLNPIEQHRISSPWNWGDEGDYQVYIDPSEIFGAVASSLGWF